MKSHSWIEQNLRLWSIDGCATSRHGDVEPDNPAWLVVAMETVTIHHPRPRDSRAFLRCLTTPTAVRLAAINNGRRPARPALWRQHFLGFSHRTAHMGCTRQCDITCPPRQY
ncbi:hypothetical protein J6590_025353 [Homalodisca vitripennis]|nr:hypothetical protein J6590_025353 [Homalodisca vitripennis]